MTGSSTTTQKTVAIFSSMAETVTVSHASSAHLLSRLAIDAAAWAASARWRLASSHVGDTAPAAPNCGSLAPLGVGRGLAATSEDTNGSGAATFKPSAVRSSGGCGRLRVRARRCRARLAAAVGVGVTPRRGPSTGGGERPPLRGSPSRSALSCSVLRSRVGRCRHPTM